MPSEPLKNSELVKYFRVYRDALPDWNVEHKVVLTRSAGPISQHIPFQALRSGAYRPSCTIWVVGPPDGAQLLHQFLRHPLEQVSRRQHETKWPLVIKAMEGQFVPAIREPLDIVEVLRLAEEEAEKHGIENMNYLNGLATLNVHVGNMDHAIEWCNRAEGRLDTIGREPADWEQDHARFARQLRDAIHGGRGLAFLADQPST